MDQFDFAFSAPAQHELVACYVPHALVRAGRPLWDNGPGKIVRGDFDRTELVSAGVKTAQGSWTIYVEASRKIDLEGKAECFEEFQGRGFSAPIGAHEHAHP
ncbi:MAG: hypothetical protein HY791_05010 [Deltaproteobacteria bacterium]|nr:hypothetical protein [Deltaproteobacteria bacterium]